MPRVRAMPEPMRLSREEARAFLVEHHGLARMEHPAGAEGARSVLRRLRYIQLDPLDPWGTNADLVALARVDGLQRGDLFRHVYPRHAFEHFAKERCLLPAEAFPWYRDRPVETAWWRTRERLQRLRKGVVEEVLEEIRERGPIAGEELKDRGRVKPLNWDGWTGTSSATALAVEVLWGDCRIVVCGRSGRSKTYDMPERALPHVSSMPGGDYSRWAVLQRVEAAGLLSTAAGATWSTLHKVRVSALPRTLVEEGLIEVVEVEGLRGTHLAPAGFRRRPIGAVDDRMRILGPLDPLLWNRALVEAAFGFEYVWEVYKPPATRRWGWYVCPLIHRGVLVGRIDGSIEGNVLKVQNIWRERGAKLDADALDAALARHAAACGATRVARPRRIRVG